MYHTLTISHAEWGYVTNLTDWSGGKAAKAGFTPDGRHTLRDDFGRLRPGIPDKDLAPAHRGGFGFVRPWDVGPDDTINKEWAKATDLDYYVAQLNGSPDPDAVGVYYPDRVFVTGEDEDGTDLPRSVMLKHLREVGIRYHAGYWQPVQIFHGINQGFPTFSQGLRADANIGIVWYDTDRTLNRNLPEGYEWECGMNANYGTLYVELEEKDGKRIPSRSDLPGVSTPTAQTK